MADCSEVTTASFLFYTLINTAPSIFRTLDFSRVMRHGLRCVTISVHAFYIDSNHPLRHQNKGCCCASSVHCPCATARKRPLRTSNNATLCARSSASLCAASFSADNSETSRVNFSDIFCALLLPRRLLRVREEENACVKEHQRIS